jgi:hypothetical protein
MNLSAIGAGEASVLNNMNPASQNVGLGSVVKAAQEEIIEIQDSALYFIDIPITAAANSTPVSVNAPFDCEIVDVIVQARATSGSGTATLRSGTNAITDAIAMATDTAKVLAGNIDDTYSILSEGDAINVITAGANDRGLVTVVVKKA